MSRIPLSDESFDLDDDVIEEEGSPGKEEQYAELSFDDAETVYEPDTSWLEDDEYDDYLGDDISDYGAE